MLDPHDAEQIPGDIAPELRDDVARRTAAIMVHGGRASEDSAVVERLVRLVEDQGLDTVAALWSQSDAETLPGTLWRLYAIRDWVRRDPEAVAHRYGLAAATAPVHEVVAGVAAPAGPAELVRLLDDVLSGVYTADLAVALERAAAFCRILAAGGAFEADQRDTISGTQASRLTHAASSLLRTAEELETAARLWRTDRLE
jgi:hypothetical protein